MGFTPQDRPAQEVLAQYYGGVAPPGSPRPPALIGRWDGELESAVPFNGASIAPSSAGVTQGSGSIAVTLPNGGYRWALQQTYNDASVGIFRTWKEAAADPGGHLLEFDVTFLTSSIPQTVTNIRLDVALNSAANWSPLSNVVVTTGRVDETIRVSIPLDQFTLATESHWYQFNLAVSGNWGSTPATIYVDGLRIVPVNAADLNDDGIVNASDLDWWRYGGAWHGDADADGDSDGHDFLAWQRQLAASGAATVPEPAAVAMALLPLVAFCACSLIGRPWSRPQASSGPHHRIELGRRQK
jgi:hypothetical protein